MKLAIKMGRSSPAAAVEDSLPAMPVRVGVEQLEEAYEPAPVAEPPAPVRVIPRDPKDHRSPFLVEWPFALKAWDIAKERTRLDPIGVRLQVSILDRICDFTRSTPPQPVHVKDIVDEVLGSNSQAIQDQKDAIAIARRR
jgi:hypothetical protein